MESGAAASSQIKADDLLDKDVENTAGDTIGDIESVIIDNDGKVAAVVVGVGGFLGMGDREVAIDWNDLTVTDGGRTIRTAMSKDQMKALPEYKYERNEWRGTAFNDPRYRTPQTARERSEDRLAGQTAGQAGQAGDWVPADRLLMSKLIGANVVNAEGETIGEVGDLVVEGGKTHLVLDVGEFLGMGGQSVTAPLDGVRIQRQGDSDDLRVSVSMSKDQLKSLPKYDADQGGSKSGIRSRN